MSGHLIGCAGDAQDLGKSHKLALVAFADSADDRTHIAFPGYEGVMKWASCSRSRAAELINDLETAGYLVQHRTARPGRRAEYVVFPHGCCELHRPEAEPRPTVATVLAWARDAGVELTEDQAAAMAAQVDADSNGSEIPDPNGSEFSDLSPSDGSEISDPLPDDQPDGSEISDPNSVRVQNGSGNGSETLDPFTTSLLTSSPSPLPRPAGQPATCVRHPDLPGISCRGCGTTQKQIDQRRDAVAAEDRRLRHLADQQAQRAAAEARRTTPADPAVRRELEHAKARIAASQEAQ